MSIYSLRSDGWELILRYLDATDLYLLLSTGDRTLLSYLKSAIRELGIILTAPDSMSLSSILSAFADHHFALHRLSISSAKHYKRSKFLEEAYDAQRWQKFFPENLLSLELDLNCDVQPLSSLLEQIATLAPQLRTLRALTIPINLTLPQSLTSLELGDQSMCWNGAGGDSIEPYFFNSMPTTLTHLKLHHNRVMWVNFVGSMERLKKLPLTVFHARIHFRHLRKTQALWSILPETIVDMRANLTYGDRDKRQNFVPPTIPSWAQLFPNLTSLSASLSSLADETIYPGCLNTNDSAFPEEQIEALSALFPASLTQLETFTVSLSSFSISLPPIIRAIGPCLRKFSMEPCQFRSAAFRSISHWENPNVRGLDTLSEQDWIFNEGEKVDLFAKYKNHPVCRIYRNATSLKTAFLPASALYFLPDTIQSLSCDIERNNHSFSLATVSKAIGRNTASNKNIDTETNNVEHDERLGWTHLGWPKSLTKLELTGVGPGDKLPTLLHLGCLPATLKELSLLFNNLVKLEEGGDLAHMKELSKITVHNTSSPLISSLHGLPRSLRSITCDSVLVPSTVFATPEFENYFDNLDELVLLRLRICVTTLLYIPKSLSVLNVETFGTDGACWSEEYFEKISRLRKLACLSLVGSTKWPSDLSLSVFRRYMPKRLVELSLRLSDWQNRFDSEDVAPHLSACVKFYCAPKVDPSDNRILRCRGTPLGIEV